MKKIIILVVLGLVLGMGCKNASTNHTQANSDKSQLSEQLTSKDDKDKCQTLVKLLKIGMTEDEVIEIIKPICLDMAESSAYGGGEMTRFYHLKGDLQLSLHFGGLAENCCLKSIHEISPKKRWHGLLWNPQNADIENAIDILKKNISQQFEDKDELSKKYKPDPAGMAVNSYHLGIELQAKNGRSINFAVNTSGCFHTHKLLIINLLDDKDWMANFAVDLDDKKIVPTWWEPTEADIKNAREIADPTIKDSLKDVSPENLRVKGYGWYDFGPQRKILTLIYAYPQGMGELLHYVSVDMQNMKLLDQ